MRSSLRSLVLALAVLTVAGGAGAVRAASIFTEKPDDAGAVNLAAPQFAIKGDGVADDTAAIQQAVNQARGSIVFLPEGRYRISKTIYVPTGTRVIGYGKTRPVILLGANTPGFQEKGRGYPFGEGKYMIHFAQNVAANGTITDASELDFNSAMSNIDFEVGEGNPIAVCVRFHVAQHSYLSHMNFKLGTALAALEDIGNASNDLRISGGQYGIISTRTSPNWQYVLMDTVFENQTVAGVRTQDVGFSFIRCNFSHMPVAIEIPQGETDQIYAKDVRFEDIRTMAVKFGDYKNFKHQITMVNTACTDVPHFVAGMEKIDAPGKHYVVERLSAGLEIGADGREAGIVMRHSEKSLPAAAPVVPSDVPALPPVSEWFTVKSLAGEDLQKAIDEHRVLYFPMGQYRATTPLHLKADTVLIGLHATRTTVSAIVSPKGGSTFVSGLGFSALAGSPNILWQSGEKSAMDDIAFSGGGGGGRGRGAPGGAPGGARAGGPPAGGAPAPAGAAQPYLVVKDGGGGTIRNVWIEGGAPTSGLNVENTSTPGKIYQLSNEHHNRVEVVLKNVQNWEFHCLQTEQENPAGHTAYPLDIEDCKNLLFANTYMYRVSRTVQPMPYAIKVRNSENIAFDNIHIFSQTRLPFDSALIEEGSGAVVRANNFTHLVAGKAMKKGAPLPLPAAFASGASLQKLADGFVNATSLTADDAGKIYFADANTKKIYRWNEADKKADVVAEIQGQTMPQVMGFVKPSTLLVSTFGQGARVVGPVYSIDINGGQPQQIAEVKEPKPGTSLLLPVGLHNRLDIMQDYINHRGYVFRMNSNTSVISVVENEARGYYYAPGTNVALMADGTGRPITQASQFAVVAPGENFYMTSEDDVRTWVGTLDKDFKLTTKLFADRGGNSVVSDADGNVYIADGNISVYDKSGKQIGTVETPERATSLAFGGADRKTLYVGARSSLYAIQAKASGK